MTDPIALAQACAEIQRRHAMAEDSSKGAGEWLADYALDAHNDRAYLLQAITALVERAEKAEGENKRLVEALEPFARISLVRDHTPDGPDMIDAPDLAITPNDVRHARAARAQPSREE